MRNVPEHPKPFVDYLNRSCPLQLTLIFVGTLRSRFPTVANNYFPVKITLYPNTSLEDKMIQRYLTKPLANYQALYPKKLFSRFT